MLCRLGKMMRNAVDALVTLRGKVAKVANLAACSSSGSQPVARQVSPGGWKGHQITTGVSPSDNGAKNVVYGLKRRVRKPPPPPKGGSQPSLLWMDIFQVS